MHRYGYTALRSWGIGEARAILWMPLCGLSLCVVMLLWPPSSLAGPEKAFSAYATICKHDMEKLYKTVEDLYRLDLTVNETTQASVRGSAQKFLEKSLPQFKEKCGPLEANSVRDLENGKYFRSVAAKREKDKKAHNRIRKSTAGATGPEDNDFEDLEIQR